MKKHNRFLMVALSLTLACSLICTPLKISNAKTKVTSVKVVNVLRNKLQIKKGKSFKLKVCLNNKLVKSQVKNFKFTSSNPKIASVKSNGTINGISAGTAKITVQSKANKKKKATVKVTVTSKVLVKSISLNKTSIEVNENSDDEIKLYVTKILPSNAKNKEVEWVSSNDDIVDIDDEGILIIGDPGTATLTAFASDNSGAYATCKVTVTNDTSDDDSITDEEDTDESEDENNDD